MRTTSTIVIAFYAACFAATVVGAEKVKQQPTEESLRDTVTAWLNAADAKSLTSSLDESWPTDKDIKVLFPKDGEKLSKFMGALKPIAEQRYQAGGTELEEQLKKRGKVQSIKAIDVRKEKSHRHQEVLKLVPGDIPVYRLTVKYQHGGGGMSSFLYVNDHWVHFQDFDSIPEMLPKLDEVLKQIEQMKKANKSK